MTIWTETQNCLLNLWGQFQINIQVLEKEGKFLHHTLIIVAAAAKSLQLCPTLCDPVDGSPPGSPIPGILQARTLEWVAIFFSNAWKWKVKVKSLSRVQLFATPGTEAYQAPPSMGFSRQEYWSGVPSPSLLIIVIFCFLEDWLHWLCKRNGDRLEALQTLTTYTELQEVEGEKGLESLWRQIWVGAGKQEWVLLIGRLRPLKRSLLATVMDVNLMVTLRGFPLNIFEHGSDAVNMMNGDFHLLAQFPCHLETQYRVY